MAFYQVLLIALVVKTTRSQECIRNLPDTMLYGDSRSDDRVASGSRDILGNEFKIGIEALSGGGFLQQFTAAFPDDDYNIETVYRLAYVGINDCSLNNAFFTLPGGMGKQGAMTAVYNAMLTKISVWKETSIGVSTNSMLVTRDAGGGYTIRRQNALAAGEVAPDITFANTRTAGIYLVCANGVGSIGGVAFAAGIKCNFYRTSMTITSFVGDIYSSRMLVVKNNLATPGRLFYSTSSTGACAELQTVWTELRAIETPNDELIYPTDGLNSNHGSVRIRDFFKGLVRGACLNVDWSKTLLPYCSGLECIMEANETGLADAVISGQAEIRVEQTNLNGKMKILEGKLEGSNGGSELLKTEVRKMVEDSQLALTGELEGKLKGLKIDEKISKANETVFKMLGGFMQQVQETGDSLGFLSILGVVGLAVGACALVLGFVLLGIKIHQFHTAGHCALCCISPVP